MQLALTTVYLTMGLADAEGSAAQDVRMAERLKPDSLQLNSVNCTLEPAIQTSFQYANSLGLCSESRARIFNLIWLLKAMIA